MGSSYWSIMSIPLSTWLLYIIIFSISTFVGFAGIAYEFLLGYGAVLLAVIFGAWVGANAVAHRKEASVAAICTFITSMLVSFISVLLVLGIELHNPHLFAFMLMQNGYTPNIYGMAVLSFGVWLAVVLVATLSSIVVAQMIGRKHG
ncbi:MAG: hypothetical protein ACP5MK_02995 [Candidatus Micrarchaeia archaeon]